MCSFLIFLISCFLKHTKHNYIFCLLILNSVWILRKYDSKSFCVPLPAPCLPLFMATLFLTYFVIYYLFLPCVHLGTFCLRRLVWRYLPPERISICFSWDTEATSNLEIFQLKSQTGGFSGHISSSKCKTFVGQVTIFFLSTLDSNLRQTVFFPVTSRRVWVIPNLLIQFVGNSHLCILSSVRFSILCWPWVLSASSSSHET